MTSRAHKTFRRKLMRAEGVDTWGAWQAAILERGRVRFERLKPLFYVQGGIAVFPPRETVREMRARLGLKPLSQEVGDAELSSITRQSLGPEP